MDLEGWHAMTRFRQEAPDTLIADFQVRADSAWFSGHFPGEPILPGVAILSMVAGMVRRLEAQQTRIAGLKRVRFRLPVKPDDILTITLHRENAGTVAGYGFQVTVREEIVCSGVIASEKTGAA